jgi:hypothetical protein
MEIVMGLLTTIIITCLVACAVNVVESIKEERIKSRSISLDNSVELSKLPIISFWNGARRFNFLLDTGSSLSLINKRELDKFFYEEAEGKGQMYGVDGKIQDNNQLVNVTLTYNGEDFKERFQVVDISAACNNFAQTYDMELHGILGNSFFTEYNFVLDFNRMIAYPAV